MNGLPYYKAYPRDFIEGTVGMSFEVKAAYRLVLDMIYMRAGALPDDARYIAGVLGCSVRAWKIYRTALIEAGKIIIREGVISNFRADKELETQRKFQEKQAENPRGTRKNKDLPKPAFSHTESEPDTEGSSVNSENVINVVPASAGSTTSDDRYAFRANTIRLTGRDLEKWRTAFPHLSLEGELWALDEWAGQQKNWFVAVSSALAKKERTVMDRISLAKLAQEAGPSRRLKPDARI